MATKVKYNVKGVDPGGDRTMPKAAVHRCKVTSCTVVKPEGKDRRIEAQYTVMDDDPKGSKGYVLYDYINLEREDLDWKLAQFIKAVGLPETGSFDPDEIVGTALNIRVKIRPETDDWAAKAVPGTLIALDGEEDEGEDLSDEDEDEDEDEDGAEEAYTEADLKKMSNDELKEAAEEVGVEDIPQRLSAKSKPKLIAAILEAQASEDEDEEDEDEDEDGDEDSYSEEDLAEMSLTELKDVAEEFEVTVPKGKPALVKKKLISLIIEAQGESEDEDDEDEDEDEDEEQDYESMELSELKALCKERKLDTKGTKKILVSRLQKDDDPF